MIGQKLKRIMFAAVDVRAIALALAVSFTPPAPAQAGIDACTRLLAEGLDYDTIKNAYNFVTSQYSYCIGLVDDPLFDFGVGGLIAIGETSGHDQCIADIQGAIAEALAAALGPGCAALEQQGIIDQSVCDQIVNIAAGQGVDELKSILSGIGLDLDCACAIAGCGIGELIKKVANDVEECGKALENVLGAGAEWTGEKIASALGLSNAQDPRGGVSGGGAPTEASCWLTAVSLGDILPFPITTADNANCGNSYYCAEGYPVQLSDTPPAYTCSLCPLDQAQQDGTCNACHDASFTTSSACGLTITQTNCTATARLDGTGCDGGCSVNIIEQCKQGFHDDGNCSCVWWQCLSCPSGESSLNSQDQCFSNCDASKGQYLDGGVCKTCVGGVVTSQFVNFNGPNCQIEQQTCFTCPDGMTPGIRGTCNSTCPTGSTPESFSGSVPNFTPGVGFTGGSHAVSGSVCKTCDAGTYGTNWQVTDPISGALLNISVCLQCPEGMTSDPGDTACHTPPIKTLSESASTKSKCGPGEFLFAANFSRSAQNAGRSAAAGQVFTCLPCPSMTTPDTKNPRSCVAVTEVGSIAPEILPICALGTRHDRHDPTHCVPAAGFVALASADPTCPPGTSPDRRHPAQCILSAGIASLQPRDFTICALGYTNDFRKPNQCRLIDVRFTPYTTTCPQGTKPDARDPTKCNVVIQVLPSTAPARPEIQQKPSGSVSRQQPATRSGLLCPPGRIPNSRGTACVIDLEDSQVTQPGSSSRTPAPGTQIQRLPPSPVIPRATGKP
jgi:hypothetical protein